MVLIQNSITSAGGLASGWFAMEAAVLTGGMAAAATAFVAERTQAKARRMFHASLLYLPIFMSALLLHRLPHSSTMDDDIHVRIHDYDKASEEEVSDDDCHQQGGKLKFLPPVAYASAAPFPFLPAPLYASPPEL